MEHLPVDLDEAMIEVLRERMKAFGVTGQRLAAATGIPQPTLARRLAHGNSQATCPLAQWERLARALETTLEDMLEEARQLLRHTGDARTSPPA